MKRFPVLALASALTLTLTIPALSQAATRGGKSTATTASASKEHATHKAKSTVHQSRMDINTATKEQLMALPGVDDATADKIIAGRPFKAKSDLLHKSIVTKAEYSKVSGRIVAKPEMKAPPESKAPESGSQSTPESK